VFAAPCVRTRLDVASSRHGFFERHGRSRIAPANGARGLDDMTRDDDRLPLDSRTQAVIDGLPPDEREHLQILMKKAARHQRTMLEKALDEAVGMVPAPLRKRVQKLFLGSS
jgi:hypothetical protein